MPPASTGTPLAPESILVLPEDDYCYGTGTLILRVEQLGADPRSLPKLEWVRVVGTEISDTGAIGATRDVLVRVAAINQSSVRPAGWLPPQR